MLSHQLRRVFRAEALSRSMSIGQKNIAAMGSFSRFSINNSLIQPYSSSSYAGKQAKSKTVATEPVVTPTKKSNRGKKDNVTPVSASPDGLEVQRYFQDHFYSSDSSNIYNLRSGTYVDIDEKDILRYFPEGMAGETNSEFEFSYTKRWMIRDSTKVVFRAIEEAEKRLNYDAREHYAASLNKSKGIDLLSSTPETEPISNNEAPVVAAATNTQVENVGLHTAIKIPRLEGKDEWPHAKLRVSYYGKELYPASSEVASSEFEGFIQSKGPGSALETTIAAINEEAKSQNKEFPDKLIITGDRGHGKSTVLNQAVMYARQRGWIVMFVPDGWEQVHYGPFIVPMKRVINGKEVTVYDNQYMNKVLLRGFWKAHHKQLKKLPITDLSIVDKYLPHFEKMKKKFAQGLSQPGRERLSFMELRRLYIDKQDKLREYDALDGDILRHYNFMESSFTTLQDLILFGIAFGSVSGWVVQDIVQELRSQRTVPVLFAVDGYNTWLAPSSFAHHLNQPQSQKKEQQQQNQQQPSSQQQQKGKAEAGASAASAKNKVSFKGVDPLMGHQLTVPHALHFLDGKKNEGATVDWTVNHGLCIAATSMRHPEGLGVRLDEAVLPSLPLRVRVNAYTANEFLSAMSYYVQPGVSPVSAILNWDEFFMFRMLSGSVPRLLRTEAVRYLLPTGVTALDEELQMSALLSISDVTKTQRAEDFDVSLGFDSPSSNSGEAADAAGVSGEDDGASDVSEEEDDDDDEEDFDEDDDDDDDFDDIFGDEFGIDFNSEDDLHDDEKEFMRAMKNAGENYEMTDEDMAKFDAIEARRRADKAALGPAPRLTVEYAAPSSIGKKRKLKNRTVMKKPIGKGRK